MRVLFLINRPQSWETFRLAKGVAEGGAEVVILFVGDGCEHLRDKDLIGSLGFADLYALCDGCLPPVGAVDYEGWVGLLEGCDETVSWT